MTTFSSTANATISITVGTVTGTVIPFGGAAEVNQLGSVLSTDVISLYHSGTVLGGTAGNVAYDINTNRSISIAGSMTFKTPRKYGQSISLGDRVEFGYKGHEAFYGWVYSIDKSNENIYGITAYDGGYGLAQVVSSAGNVPITSTLSTSLILGLFALQVGGLGATKTEHLGVDFAANTVNTQFGWGFSQGQVLQKIEAIMLGSGYLSVVDYLSNLTLTNYITGTVTVATITLRENTDNFVVLSKAFNPATEYGVWSVSGIGTSGATLTATAGSGKPLRPLGGSWLLVPAVSTLTIGSIATEYQGIFQNGVWTVQTWSPFWFDPSGVDLRGSVSSYLGDGPYAFVTVPGDALYVVNLTSGTDVASLNNGNLQGGAYVTNPASPQVCFAAGGIQKVGSFLTAAPSVVATISTAGTLTGQSIVYDGLNTLYSAVSGGTVYATNFYSNVSSVVATLAATITSLLSPNFGTVYVGTSGGVFLTSGATVTGTAAYNVSRMFADTQAGVVYVCGGGTLLPYFPIGGSSVTGTLVASASITVGAAMSDGSGRVFLGGGTVLTVMQNGTALATISVGNTLTICDLAYDTALSAAVVTAYGINISVGTKLKTYSLAGSILTAVSTVNVSSIGTLTARTADALMTRQNLYNLQFADGTKMFNAIIASVNVAQTGVTVTFESGQITAGVFAGPADVTQLSLWNVVNTSQS